jgi:sulfate permease, SulP family
MITQVEHFREEAAPWAGDLWGGLAAMLVALPSSIAFGVLTYTVMGPEYAGAGAMAGILGAAALGIVAPLIGRTGGLISAPCAPAAAVLSTLIFGLLGGDAACVIAPADVLVLMPLTALFAAGLQMLFGFLGAGRLIKFIPYPVVSGYLSGVGILIALGQLPKLFGLSKGTPLAVGLISPGLWKWQGLAVGIITICLVGTAPRITRRIPAAIVGLFGGIVSYFVIGLFSAQLLDPHNNPLVVGAIDTSGSFLETIFGRTTSLSSVSLNTLRLITIPALTLSVLLSIDTLKTCVGLNSLKRGRHDADRELVGQGVGNLASFLVGGMPGAGTMGPTLVNVASGGRTPRSGVIAGGLVVLVLLFLRPLIAWVPIGALSGILLFIAWRMFDKSMFRMLRYPAGRQDFAVIAGVILVAVTVDLIAAAGVGIGLAILLFIRDQVRGSVIRRRFYLNEISSKTRRLASERELLMMHGHQGVFCQLQGNLFFGTTDQLFSQLEPDLRTKRFILLDMRRVQSMDYTAAHLFEQMHEQLAERGGQLIFSGMPSGLIEQRDFEHYLVQLGVVREGGGVMISETLDGALEWMEERILEDAGLEKERERRLLEIRDFDLFREFDQITVRELTACARELSLAQGDKIFSREDEGDEMFLVRRGSVRIMLPLEGGKRHHLATIGRGGFFGELSFLDRGVRSADVEAKTVTDLYALSRARFNVLSRSSPTAGVQVFARLAIAIAERLRQTDAELRVLEER